MIWVVCILLIASFSLNVLFAVLVSRRAATHMLYLDRAHERTTEYTKDLLDRLMVREWTDYRDLNEMPMAFGTVEQLPEPELVPVLGPDRGGFGSRLGLSGYTISDEINPEEEME